ncbi:MAG: iron-sulfur cluster assembly accessory protein [Pseudomonadota bacterium]
MYAAYAFLLENNTTLSTYTIHYSQYFKKSIFCNDSTLFSSTIGIISYNGTNSFYMTHEQMSIQLSLAAQQQIQKEMNKQPNALGVRLHLQTAGCSGYMYKLNVIDHMVDESDLCFGDAIKIYVAQKDYSILKGTEIDFVREGLNQIFKYKNPNETGACGCGESFTIDNKFEDLA